MDRCLTAEVSGIKTYVCYASTVFSAYGLTGDGCISIATTTYCAYSYSNCAPEATSTNENSGSGSNYRSGSRNSGSSGKSSTSFSDHAD